MRVSSSASTTPASPLWSYFQIRKLLCDHCVHVLVFAQRNRTCHTPIVQQVVFQISKVFIGFLVQSFLTTTGRVVLGGPVQCTGRLIIRHTATLEHRAKEIARFVICFTTSHVFARNTVQVERYSLVVSLSILVRRCHFLACNCSSSPQGDDNTNKSERQEQGRKVCVLSSTTVVLALIQ